jgi:hypothetical protein
MSRQRKYLWAPYAVDGFTTIFLRDFLTSSGDVATRYMRTYAQGTSAPTIRLKTVRLLEKDFGLPQGSVVMYCPDKGMNAKIAKVKISVDGEIAEFDQWEREHKTKISGGHLDAQQSRFQRLWRVHFFIDRQAKEVMGRQKAALLRSTIEQLLLPKERRADDLRQMALDLAERASHISDMPLYQQSPTEIVGARHSQLREDLYYPTGAPSLSAFHNE